MTRFSFVLLVGLVGSPVAAAPAPWWVTAGAVLVAAVVIVLGGEFIAGGGAAMSGAGQALGGLGAAISDGLGVIGGCAGRSRPCPEFQLVEQQA